MGAECVECAENSVLHFLNHCSVTVSVWPSFCLPIRWIRPLAVLEQHVGHVLIAMALQ